MAISTEGVTPSQENADKLFPPSTWGPVWETDENDNYLFPEHTIGWEAITWAETKLSALQGEGMLRLTDEQRRMVLWLYAVNRDGTWRFEQTVIQLFKGAGKDPLASVLCLIELLGPCRFSHWGPDGSPVAKDNPDALVQLFAVSGDQNYNTLRNFPKLINADLRAEHGMDVQKEVIYAHQGRRKLEAKASAFRSAEGNPPSFALFNEVQHWTPSNGGHDLYQTISDNIAKVPASHLLAISNAYQPGEESVLESIRDHVEDVNDGKAEFTGWLYISNEAHPDAPLAKEWAPFILSQLVGDAWWQRSNIDRLVRRALDTSRPSSRSRRMFYNQIVTAEDAFLSEAELMATKVEGMHGSELDLSPGDEIVLGFDGGKTDDATALVAIRIKDRLIVPIHVEERPLGPLGDNWRVEQTHLDETVNRVFAQYDVKAFFADTELWESYISLWSERFGHRLQVRAGELSAIGWDMRGSKERIARNWEAYRQAFIDQTLTWNGNSFFRRHGLNAKLGHNGKGLIARKEKPNSKRKIDTFVAAYIAYAALLRYIEKNNRPEKPKNESRPAPVMTGYF